MDNPNMIPERKYLLFTKSVNAERKRNVNRVSGKSVNV